MCKWGTDKVVEIRQTITVDECIADQVVWLNSRGVKTVNSCCGHGKGPGSILIQPSTAAQAGYLGYEVTQGEGYPSIAPFDDWALCPNCSGRGGWGDGGFDMHGEWQAEPCGECGGSGRAAPPPGDSYG